MKKRILYGLLFVLLFPLGGTAQSTGKIERELRGYVGTLAGEAFGGRPAGTRQDTLTMEYLRDFLAAQKGIELLYDNGVQAFTQPGWFQGVSSFNVVGFIEGNDPALKNEIILIGAHYDHMGLESDSWGQEPAMKYGADDNASGTALVMALAKRLARERKSLKRSVMIAFFGAEERGLVGSTYMARNLPEGIATDRIACMVNFDMVGRLTPERGMIFFGLGSGVELDSYLRSFNPPFPEGTPVNYNASVFASSDHSPFYDQGIPAFMFFTGIHSDYHKSTDTIDKVNFMGMAMIYRYAKEIVKGLADGERITYKKDKAE